MMIEDAFSEVEKAAGPKSICRIFDVDQNTDGRITIENMEIDSSSLSRNLKGCVKVVLFGATLGAGSGSSDQTNISDGYEPGRDPAGMRSNAAGRVLR